MSMTSATFFSGLAKKNFWLYLFSFGIAPTGYIIKVILSHEISVEEIGALYAVISLVTILSSYNDFGMTESLNFFVPGFLEKKEYSKVNQGVVSALLMQMGTSVLIGCGLWLGAEWLSENYFQSQYTYDLLRVFTFFFFADNFFNTLSVFYQSAHDTFRQKLVEMVRYWSLTTYVVILWVSSTPAELGDYAWGWVIWLMIWVVFSIIMLLHWYRDILRHGIVTWDKKITKKIFSYAIWVVFSANVGLLLSQIDMQMIVFLLGEKEAGYYTNYLSIMRIPFMFLLPWVVFLFPVISRLFSQWDTQKMQEIRSGAYKYFSVLGVMVWVYFFVFGKLLTVFLFGEKFAQSGYLLMFSSLFLACNFLLQVDFQFLSGTGRVKEKMYVLLQWVLLNIILNLIWIRYLWAPGAALATGIGWVFLWWRTQSKITIPCNFSYSFFFRNCVVIFLIWTVGYITLDIYNFGRFSGAIIATCAVFVFAGSFVALNKKDMLVFWKMLRS